MRAKGQRSAIYDAGMEPRRHARATKRHVIAGFFIHFGFLRATVRLQLARRGLLRRHAARTSRLRRRHAVRAMLHYRENISEILGSLPI